MSSDEREVVPGVLRGYRSWGLTEGGVLTAVNSPYLLWNRGKNRAMCANGHFVTPPYEDSSHGGEAPVADCTCGIYAMHRPDLINNSYVSVSGSIKAYGKVILHEDGFRTQWAEIEGLVLHPMLNNHVWWKQKIQNRYQVPIYASGAELLYHHPPVSVEHLIPRWTPTGYGEPYPLRAEEASDA